MLSTLFVFIVGASLLILANKQDLGGALSYQTISDILNLSGSDISGRHCHVIGCSGVTGEGLKDGFDWIVNDISSRVFIMS